MEFWGAEIKPGQTVKVEPEEGFILHLSQASLGESKKGNVPVLLNLKVGEQKFVLGTLSHDKFPQLSFDLIFDDEFELSHNWKNGSVYLVGYKSMLAEEDEFSDDFDSDEEAPQLIPAGLANGEPEKTGKAADAKAKAAKNPFIEALKEGDTDSDESDDDEDEDDVDSDEAMLDGESDDEDDDSDDEEEEEEETPKKVESGKKRPAESGKKTPAESGKKTPAESATKTPASKKAKVTPEKTEGKKAGHSATPHPAKQTKKTPGNKPQPQTPISNGKKSNKKAKHGGK